MVSNVTTKISISHKYIYSYDPEGMDLPASVGVVAAAGDSYKDEVSDFVKARDMEQKDIAHWKNSHKLRRLKALYDGDDDARGVREIDFPDSSFPRLGSRRELMRQMKGRKPPLMDREEEEEGYVDIPRLEVGQGRCELDEVD